MKKLIYAEPQEIRARVHAVAKALHNLPLSQARYVLKAANDLLDFAHVVDVTSDRFNQVSEEFPESDV